MKKSIILFLLFISSLLMAVEPEKVEILEKARIFSESKNIHMICNLVVKRSSGDKERELEVYLNQNLKQYKILIQVLSPKFLKKLKFLSINDGGQISKWMSSTRGVKRLNTSNSSDSLFDSDFTVEDLSALDLNEYNWKAEENTLQDDFVNFVLTPKSTDNYYDKKIISVNRTNFLIYSIVYFKGEKPIKEYSLLKSQIIDNDNITSQCQMKSYLDDSISVIDMSEIKIPENIPAKIFNKGNL